MLRTTRRLPLGVLVAVLAGTVLFIAAGSASAAKLVTSDSISWKGLYSPASGLVTVTSCKVKSDEETTIFPCGMTVIIGSGPSIESKWFGPDGEGFFVGAIPLALVKPGPPVEKYAGSGPCFEVEESDLPGTTELVRYPCFAKVKVAFNTAKSTVSGSYKILEEPGQP